MYNRFVSPVHLLGSSQYTRTNLCRSSWSGLSLRSLLHCINAAFSLNGSRVAVTMIESSSRRVMAQCRLLTEHYRLLDNLYFIIGRRMPHPLRVTRRANLRDRKPARCRPISGSASRLSGAAVMEATAIKYDGLRHFRGVAPRCDSFRQDNNTLLANTSTVFQFSSPLSLLSCLISRRERSRDFVLMNSGTTCMPSVIAHLEQCVRTPA